MFTGYTIHWTALILFFAAALVSLWVAHSFMGKGGLYLFSAIMVAIVNLFPSVWIFSKSISMGVVILPVIYLCLMLALKKYGKLEAYKIFFLDIIVFAVMFVLNFFSAAYIDIASGASTALRWDNFGPYVGGMLAFAVCSWIGSIFMTNFETKTYYSKALILSLVCTVDNLIFVFVALTFLSVSALDLLIILAIRIAITFIVCFIESAFFKHFNREPDVDLGINFEQENTKKKKRVRKTINK